jgi:aryl-alcohol dehydrogenase-like predicted oxidoreductase
LEIKRLGGSDILISGIGLGAAHLSLSTRPPESQAIAVLHRALTLGVSLIDTADSYCKDETDKHHNEKLIRRALQQYDGTTTHVVVATKGGLTRFDGDWTCNGNPNHLRKAIRASFEALGGEKPIDLWQFHAPDPNFTVRESLVAAKEAKGAGLIRSVGVSNFSLAEIEEARSVVEIVSVQNQYSPWHRQPECTSIINYCEAEGLTFFPWSPLGGSPRLGRLGDINRLRAIADEKGVSVHCLVLAWHRAKSSCIVPIPGASKTTSIEDAVRAIEVKLSSGEINRIEAAATLRQR